MLRALKPLLGSRIHAGDGFIGNLQDFYLDDATWAVRYLVVDTGGWLNGRLVLVSPVAFESANWEGHEVFLTLSKKQVEESPDISVDLPVSRQHELELHRYYGWSPYWGGGGLFGPSLVGLYGDRSSSGHDRWDGHPRHRYQRRYRRASRGGRRQPARSR